MKTEKLQFEIIRDISSAAVDGLIADLAFCHPGIKGISYIDRDKGIIELEIREGLSDIEIEDMRKQITSVVDMSVKSFRFVEDIQPLWQYRSEYNYNGTNALKNFTDLYMTELGPGQYSYHDFGYKLYEYFCNRIKRLAEDVGAEMWHLPSIEMTHDLIVETGYFSSHPQLVTFGYRLPPHYETIQCFAKSAKDKRLSYVEDSHLLEPTGFILEPFVCHNVYRSLKNNCLREGRTISAEGRCYRFEGFRFSPLLRQWEFTMREIVLVGNHDYIMTMRDHCIELTKLLIQELDISANLEIATDPFFVSAAASARTFQMMQSTKLELRLRIDDKKSTAAVSFNIHGKHFTHPMQICDSNGEILETACIAFGIERWIAAFISRWSEDPKKWPISL